MSTMILNVISAEYRGGFTIFLSFNNGESFLVDLKETLFNDHRKIFEPLRNQEYFRNFRIRLNTIVWENEADFAPEFLLQQGKMMARRHSLNA